MLWLAAALPARAAEDGVLVRGGYLLQRVSFDQGYGAFLERRFGAPFVDLAGPAVSVMVPAGGEWGLGAELDVLEGGFDYVTLNGQPGSAEFSLRQALAKLHLLPPGGWEYVLGVGLNALTRSLESLRSADITAANVAQNQGVAESTTRSWVGLGEVLYRVRPLGLRAELGLRFSYSPHFIDREDAPAALDEAERPVDATFNVGGLAWLAWLTLAF